MKSLPNFLHRLFDASFRRKLELLKADVHARKVEAMRDMEEMSPRDPRFHGAWSRLSEVCIIEQIILSYLD